MGPILFGLHEFGVHLYIVAGHQFQMLGLVIMLGSLPLQF
jgi:hypothetical protein